jgi:bifunctional oligoribonuclease and PAP phosphatase NrnA
MDVGPGRGWQSFHEIVEQYERFLLTSHVFPEGDSLGSEVALALYLRDRGKRATILNPTQARACYQSLVDLYPVHALGENGHSPIPEDTEVVVALDVCQYDYLGQLGGILQDSGLPLVAIDHHHPGGEFGDLVLIDPTAASTGEMLYGFFRWAGARITPSIAHAIYTSLMFDTGGFRAPHTTNRSVLIAADLLRHGVDHPAVARAIFQSESYPRTALYRKALEALRYEKDGRIAWVSIPHTAFLDTQTTLHDGDGILDNLLSISEIEICVLLREVAGSGVRITFRSKGRHDVGEVATRLGGGGRPTASGVFLPVSLDEAEGLILPIVRDLHETADPATIRLESFRD